jgi:tetratricopeptide (TPR) repeat protein
MVWKKIWTVLNTEIKWPDGTETVKGGVDATKALLELAKALNEKKTATELAPLVGSMSSLLDVLNSPLVQVAGTALPFVSIAAGMLKFVLEQTHKEPTLQECVVLIGQAAYLKSLSEFLNSPDNQAIKHRLLDKPASEDVSKQITALGKKLEGNDFELNEREAKEALVCFHESKLAKEFNPVLTARFQDAGLVQREAEIVTERVSRSTHRYMKEAFAEAGESVKQLAYMYGDGWLRDLEVYQSIDDYLQEVIAQKPKEKVFEESFGFEDIYVPLQVKPVDKDSRVKDKEEAKNIEQWAVELLQDSSKKRQVLFIQGGPGRGKSVFCRMFAELVRRDLHPIWTPILIRLRDISAFDPTNFDQTLEAAVGTRFTKEKDWLTERNTRFLFVLDGFDELLLERGAKNELKYFLDQVGSFQSTCATLSDRGHRILITGRPMALYGIVSMPSNLERVEILPMEPEIQQQWFGKWEMLVGTDAAQKFQAFLKDYSCPKQVQTLAQEPLLLYLLAKMHREGHLRVEMFQQASPEGVKIKIYEETINWVLTKQRTDWTGDDLNEKIADPEVFRSILTEAGLCVVQSGGEHAAISMIEERLGQKDEDAKIWLEAARRESQDDALKNALAAFYLKSAAEPDKRGDPKVEFYHKSFGEFLCAQRLQESLEEWTEKKGKRGKTYTVSTEQLNWEIYDLLGFGNLTPEIVEYLMTLLKQSDVDWEVLFERLEGFYLDWCRGEFIEALDPAAENLPLKKVRQLQKYGIEEIGQRTVDIYAGFNVLILLFELHRYAQTQDELKDKISFHPCGQPDTEEFDRDQLLRMIGYSQCLGANAYTLILRRFLRGANLRRTDLTGTELRGAFLSGACLSRAFLSGAFLGGADLRGADLRGADLRGAFLRGADLRGADLRGADLRGADLGRLQSDNETKWGNAIGLHEAVGVPLELAQQPAFQAAVSLSQGMSWVEEGKVEDAIQAYEQAQTLDPNLQISAQSWDTLCRYGCLHGRAWKVLFAGDKAVKLEPDNKAYQHSRGLARGCTGDIAGAKEDFQAVLDSGYLDKREEQKQRRVRWVEVLEAGENPFTPEELEDLRRDYGLSDG